MVIAYNPLEKYVKPCYSIITNSAIGWKNKFKVKKVWDSALTVENVWGSVIKVEKVCQKLRKYEKFWCKLRKCAESRESVIKI